MERLYPINYKGINLIENECDSLFSAAYSDKAALRDDMGVYVGNGVIAYPLPPITLDSIIDIADNYYDGHFSIHKFTTGYKGHFSTISDDVRDYLNNLPKFNSLKELYIWMIIEYNKDRVWNKN